MDQKQPFKADTRIFSVTDVFLALLEHVQETVSIQNELPVLETRKPYKHKVDQIFS